MRRYLVFLCVCSFLLITKHGFSQGGNNGTVKGKVVDSLSSAPLGFASVRIFNHPGKKLVDGNITTESGEFSISVPFGRYYAEVEFMGYHSKTTAAFSDRKSTRLNSSH